MLRSKGLTDKILLLGIDGMDPKFTCRMLREGKMPNVQKLIERGSAREDLMLLGGIPTITPPMWTTLATGSYPMTHGVEDFNITMKGELDINFNGIYSKLVHAEPLWNITAEAGKKTLVWHWPGGAWPPTSDNPNLMAALVPAMDVGTLRECFFVNQLRKGHKLEYPQVGDVLVDGKWLFEIGGRKKSFNQIKDIPDSYLAIADTETGRGNRIPIWMFGLLY